LLSIERTAEEYGVKIVARTDGSFEIDASGTEKMRASAGKSSVSLYDFGYERDAYDHIWPREVCNLIAVRLRDLPRPLATRFKRTMLELVDENRPITMQNMEEIWLECSKKIDNI
jgi:N-methylhydantoinase B